MKKQVLALTAATLLGAGAAHAAPITFTYTGAIVTYTVPTTGIYDIVAYGAQGGGAIITDGGLGAKIGGDVSLTAGEMLSIAVGGTGSVGGASLGAGGGGGSFVVAPGGIPLVIAGGGGGATVFSTGGAGVIAMGSGTGGSAGASAGGGGGGGFKTTGASSSNGASSGGGSYPSLSGGTNGASRGGFGGGGAGGAGSAGNGGGGGGGYSGGNGGSSENAGSGGGSFDAGLTNADFIQIAGGNSGNGLVTINLISAAVSTPTSVPEPVSLVLLGTGLVSLAAVRWRHSSV